MAISIFSKTPKTVVFIGEFYGYKGGNLHKSEKILSRKRLGYSDSVGDKAELVTIEVDCEALKELSYFDGDKWFFRGVETDPLTGRSVSESVMPQKI